MVDRFEYISRRSHVVPSVTEDMLTDGRLTDGRDPFKSINVVVPPSDAEGVGRDVKLSPELILRAHKLGAFDGIVWPEDQLERMEAMERVAREAICAHEEGSLGGNIVPDELPTESVSPPTPSAVPISSPAPSSIRPKSNSSNAGKTASSKRATKTAAQESPQEAYPPKSRRVRFLFDGVGEFPAVYNEVFVKNGYLWLIANSASEDSVTYMPPPSPQRITVLVDGAPDGYVIEAFGATLDRETEYGREHIGVFLIHDSAPLL